MIAPHNRFGQNIRMANYSLNEDDVGRLNRCAVCDGTVIAEVACPGWADANTVCASCGMTLLDSPFEGSDYFDVIMRVGRPIWRGARLRRAG
jgi:hypothetical protein